MPVTKHSLRGMHKPFLREVYLLENEVQALLDEWEEYNNELVQKHTSSTGIKDLQKLTLLLLKAVEEFLEQYGIVMDKRIGNITAVKAKQVLEESLPLLRSVNDEIGIAYIKKDMQGFVAQLSKSWVGIGIGKYGITFLERHKALEYSTKRTLNNILTLAKKEKMGGIELQKILKDYINPNTEPGKPFDIARKALGASKKYVPKGVLSGSVQTNVYEISRNQASDLWRDLTQMAYEGAEWVDGYEWVLSASHPRYDICDELAEHGVYDKDEPRPYSHGHCLCDWIPHLRSRQELEDILKSKGTLYNSKYVK